MNTTKRGLLATIGAAVAAAALVLTGSVAATAAPLPVPTQSAVTITKLSQPGTLGQPANGTQLPSMPTGSSPIAGVVFDYYLVTNTGVGAANDIGTQTGQVYASGLTAATAPVPGTKTGSFDVTVANGQTTKTLPRGLYVVKESTTPAGVTPAAPFLLAVPLTDPVNRDNWLSTIYVYPKNAQTGATKTVGSESLTVGGTATWTISADIPRNANPAGGTPAFVAPDAFEIDDTLTDAELTLNSVTVKAGATTLTSGTDYTVTPVSSGGTTKQQIVFTASGLAALATAINADANAKVVATLVTTVNKAAVISNSASVFPDKQSKTNNTPITTPPVQTKYGSYLLNKKSSDTTVTDLSGAQFRVYASQASAIAGGNDYLTTSTNTAGLWTTAANGQVLVGGLRYSSWANGTTTATPQTYWLVEVKALPNHQLLAAPVSFTVDDNSATQTTTIVNQKTTGGFVLPLTGGSGVALFTVFGIGILAAVLVVARLRRRSVTED